MLTLYIFISNFKRNVVVAGVTGCFGCVSVLLLIPHEAYLILINDLDKTILAREKLEQIQQLRVLALKTKLCSKRAGECVGMYSTAYSLLSVKRCA